MKIHLITCVVKVFQKLNFVLICNVHTINSNVEVSVPKKRPKPEEVPTAVTDGVG
ncbi:N-acetylmuramoyl-L-alanine amidase [Bacillus cereus]|nr:N-acetylmuramoyl-L-alanine amidase [Bacillus cereus]